MKQPRNATTTANLARRPFTPQLSSTCPAVRRGGETVPAPRGIPAPQQAMRRPGCATTGGGATHVRSWVRPLGHRTRPVTLEAAGSE
jgi:hypothetical protein